MVFVWHHKEVTFLSSMEHRSSGESLAAGTEDQDRETLTYRCKTSWHLYDTKLAKWGVSFPGRHVNYSEFGVAVHVPKSLRDKP